jgi:hypothetical protein
MRSEGMDKLINQLTTVDLVLAKKEKEKEKELRNLYTAVQKAYDEYQLLLAITIKENI